jgi:hypothetical protein
LVKKHLGFLPLRLKRYRPAALELEPPGARLPAVFVHTQAFACMRKLCMHAQANDSVDAAVNQSNGHIAAQVARGSGSGRLAREGLLPCKTDVYAL